MPKLIKLYITNVAIGFALAALFVGLLLSFNIANLWHLISTSDKGWLALLILWFAHGIIFAGVQFAIAVMRMKDDDDDEPRGGTPFFHQSQAELVPVKAETPRERRRPSRRF